MNLNDEKNKHLKYRYIKGNINMSIKEEDQQKSLKDKLSKPRTVKIAKYLNSKINRVKLGDAIYDMKDPLNLFDLNRVGKEERFMKKTQESYLIELLKATTPNFKADSPTFSFNTTKTIGWVVLEFEINSKLSASKNIKYIYEYIKAEINVEPTLISLMYGTLYVTFLFPNYPTTNDYERLKKYRYFKDVRKAITHSLEANWDVTVDNYNETKIYPNLLDSKYLLIGAIFEIGIFQDLLDKYKETDMCKTIIKKKLAYGGYKSGLEKAKLPEEERKLLTQPANEKKVFMSKIRLEETLLHIIDTEENPKFTIDNIVTTSKRIFDRGLGHKTVAKYLKEIKSDLCIE